MQQSQIKELDKIWYNIIKQRDIYCQKCGSNKALAAHHIFSRTHRSTCWDINNGILLCYPCHIFKAHKDPTEFTIWLEELKGRKFINALRRKKNQIVKNQKYEDILMELHYVKCVIDCLKK